MKNKFSKWFTLVYGIDSWFLWSGCKTILIYKNACWVCKYKFYEWGKKPFYVPGAIQVYNSVQLPLKAKAKTYWFKVENPLVFYILILQVFCINQLMSMTVTVILLSFFLQYCINKLQVLQCRSILFTLALQHHLEMNIKL